MSCNSCGRNNCDSRCYEARLSLGLNHDASAIVGSLDGVYIKPIPLKEALRRNETNTALKYDSGTRSIVFYNEKAQNGDASPDFVPSRQILSGASISDIGNIGDLVEGGLGSIVKLSDRLELQFNVPIPVAVGEVSGGLLTYVRNPVDGVHYKSVQPGAGGTSDTVLIGHPNGSTEFATPIDSPVLVPIDNLTSGGTFSGTPSTSSGNWRYQQMGQSQVITNNSGSRVEVILSFRYSLQTAGNRSGVYATLVNGGTDYKTTFVEGLDNLKQEGYPGGNAQFTVVLSPNQRCQFRFGAWTNGPGNIVATIGSYDETAGVAKQTVHQPIITTRRLI